MRKFVALAVVLVVLGAALAEARPIQQSTKVTKSVKQSAKAAKKGPGLLSRIKRKAKKIGGKILHVTKKAAHKVGKAAHSIKAATVKGVRAAGKHLKTMGHALRQMGKHGKMALAKGRTWAAVYVACRKTIKGYRKHRHGCGPKDDCMKCCKSSKIMRVVGHKKCDMLKNREHDIRRPGLEKRLAKQKRRAARKAAIKRVGHKIKNGLKKVGGKIKRGAKKIGGKIKHGLKKMGGKLKHGAKKVAGKVAHGAKKVAHGAKKVAGKIKRGAKKVAGKVKHVASKAAGAIKHAAHKAGHAIKHAAHKAKHGVKKLGSKLRGLGHRIKNGIKNRLKGKKKKKKHHGQHHQKHQKHQHHHGQKASFMEEENPVQRARMAIQKVADTYAASDHSVCSVVASKVVSRLHGGKKVAGPKKHHHKHHGQKHHHHKHHGQKQH